MPRAAGPVSGNANPARYVAIRMKIKPAIMPDSGDTLPSQMGRAMNRRAARKAMEMATAVAKTATKPK